MKLQDKAVTTADYNKALENGKRTSRVKQKAQEDLKKHVK